MGTSGFHYGPCPLMGHSGRTSTLNLEPAAPGQTLRLYSLCGLGRRDVGAAYQRRIFSAIVAICRSCLWRNSHMVEPAFCQACLWFNQARWLADLLSISSRTPDPVRALDFRTCGFSFMSQRAYKCAPLAFAFNGANLVECSMYNSAGRLEVVIPRDSARTIGYRITLWHELESRGIGQG